ncbi:hypothetical protein CEQ90_09945 [Lewinellaceae bacterium SD302]|nr:hypothetical protein CEQ90_09945 [Lewinellaceae bacterium SD302]
MRLVLTGLFLSLFFSLTAQQQSALNLVQIDTCANYFIVDEAIAAPYDAAGTFLFFHQHRGAAIITEDSDQFGSISELNGTGRYELNRVAAVNGDTVFAQFKLRHDYLTDDNSTSVTFATPVDAPVSGPLSPAPFNGNRGGILLLGSDDPITINGDLDASKLGFAGGQESIRDSDCGFLTNANDYFYDSDNWRGAFKGGGAAALSFLNGRETGRGPNLNGGGGGNDHNSGGGGGANITNGGEGASNEEPGFFNCSGNFPGLGGRPLPGNEASIQRIHFGGGGGAGHGNNPNPTAGGNGGGIIVVSAPGIVFNGSPTLSVKGGDALEVGGDGGGGGGAGGSILLFTESVSGAATMDLSGGNGADVNNEGQNRCFGPGGGGSGGRLLYNGPPTGEWSLLVAGGTGGESINGLACAPGENVAQNGSVGLSEAAIQQPQTIQEALNYPSETIVLEAACIGSALEIGNAEDQSCFAAQWFINTPNAFETLAGNPDYGPTNLPSLNILSLPEPVIGGTVEYRLERYGPNGQIVAVLSIRIPLIDGPTAAFTAVTDQLTVAFTNNSTGASGQQWFYGDGLVSTEEDPEHTYSASGTYEVTLVVSSDCGNDTLIQEVTVLATVPTAAIGVSSEGVCSGDTIFLYNLSENATSVEWSGPVEFMPDAISDTVFVVLDAPGTETVMLTAQNGDMQNVTSIEIFAAEPPLFTLTASVNGNVLTALAESLMNGANLTWEISGVGTFTGESITVELPGPGLYDVIFTADNGLCPPQIEVFTVEVFEPTVAIIDQTITAGCAPLSVQFNNLSTGPIDSLRWNFPDGDPATGNQSTENVTFNEPGTYEVELTVFSPTGPQIATQTIQVFEPPVASFTTEEDLGFLITTNLSMSASSYQWDFGDGSGSNEFEPTHQYEATGTYEVTLNAFNDFCSRAISQTVFVDMISSVANPEDIGLAIYPNPTSGQLQITGPAGQFSVVNALGQTLFSNHPKARGNMNVDLGSQPAGIYLLRFEHEGTSYTFRIQKD